MKKPIATGALTLEFGGIGVVTTVGRHHRADGAWILKPGALYTTFAPDWCVHLAVIGDNVCKRPLESLAADKHSCGRSHLVQGDLDQLTRAGQVA